MIKGKPLSCAKKPTPLAPLIRGGLKTCLSPSLDKGRAGEGLASDSAFLPYNKNLTERARENRKAPTPAESKIWNKVLRMRQFADHKFLRQKPIDNYIVDFYCSELRLVIEIDGDSHAESVEYDAERTRVLQSLGLTVIRYTNDDVIRNIQGIYDNLSERIEKLTPLAPLIRGGLKTCLSPSLIAPPDKGAGGLGRAGEGLEVSGRDLRR
ncbi:MAG: endonuclease domain-containing protein [Deltaproteobacteria bacterium]|nr:endonuclease domain-containing protein [Deltaproteobacteria bacterium]